MQTVYVLFGCVAYEGCDIIGVFSTLEAAQACRDGIENPIKRWDTLPIESHVIDEPDAGSETF